MVVHKPLGTELLTKTNFNWKITWASKPKKCYCIVVLPRNELEVKAEDTTHTIPCLLLLPNSTQVLCTLSIPYSLYMQGPMFGAMMISKQKVAHLALKPLGRNNAIDGTCGVGTKDPQLIFASADIEEIVDD
ncbi:Thiamine thiazole synthase, chloroplastic [Glycine max]|nr:Thiamine thiazole synthase, chloroplastic [Glycine max]